MGYAKANPLRREPGVSIAFPVRSVRVQQDRGCISVASKKGDYLLMREQSADSQSHCQKEATSGTGTKKGNRFDISSIIAQFDKECSGHILDGRVS